MQYLLESAFCLALLYTFYHVVLRRETFFQINRAYLLLAPLVALMVPALNLRLEKPAPPEVVSAIPEAAAQQTLPNDAWLALVENMSAAPAGVEQVWEKPLFNLTLGEVAWWIYLLVASVLVLRLLVQLTRMLLFLRRCRLEKSGEVVLATGPKNTPLSSFFGFVFWHPGSENNDEQHLMFEHEMVHVRQWHSLDILFIELLIALQWFNPFLYIYRRSLREVHEYIADEQVVLKTGSAYNYAKLLAKRYVSRPAVEVQPILVNTFHSELKKRLTMLAQQPSHPARRAKLLLVLPVFALLMTLFAFRLVEEIPAANKLMESVETYEQGLAEFVVLSDKSAEPVPYALYWGALQVKLEYNQVTGAYNGEALASPEILREVVKREPRIWNGKGLEQHVRLRFNNVEVRSDYQNEDVYLEYKRKLVERVGKLSEKDVVSLELELPGNQKAVVRIGLGEPTPEWIKAKDMKQVDWSNDPLGLFADFGPRMQSVLWDGRDMKLKTALSEETFWSVIKSPPVVVFTDGSMETVTQNLALLLVGEDGHLVSRVPDGAPGMSWQEFSAKLDSLRHEIKPGVSVGIYRVLTPEERQTGDNTRSRVLLAVGIVTETNPLVFLKRDEKSDFRLTWGDYVRSMTNEYGLAYWDGYSHETIMYADAPSTATPWYLSKKAFERLVKETPQFYHEDSLVANVTFFLVHNGKTYSYFPNYSDLPLKKPEHLAAEVQNGDVIRLEMLSATYRPYRQVIVPRKLLKTLEETVITTEYSAIDVALDQGPVRLTIAKRDFDRLKDKWRGQPDVWFQYGDIHLGRATQEIIIRDDPPKAPLTRTAAETNGAIKLSVSPNPMRENAVITLVSPVTGVGHLGIVDASGRVAFRQKVRCDRAGELVTFVVQRQELSVPGVYVATVELGGKVGVCRLVVE